MVDRTVSAGLAGGLLDFAVSKGADRAVLLAQSGIDSAALADRDSRIAYSRYVALMRAGKKLSGDPALALHYGAAVDLEDISVVGLIGKASATMAEALVQLNRYGKLVIDVDLPGHDRFDRVLRGGAFWMVDRREDPDSFAELTEATFARMICGVRRFAPDLAVEEVHVTHAAPAYAAEYERIFRAPVIFGSHWNAYRTDIRWLTRTLNLQPSYVFGILTAHAEALIQSLEASESIRGQVESLVLPVHHSGNVSIDRVAGELAISRQTLYRKLKAEGTSFEKLLDELRHTLALQYLGGRKVSVNETAYLLGFSDPASFSRAFKRWTGMSPRDARGQQHLTLT